MILLSERQKEAFDLFAEGKSIKDIAISMGISYGRAVTLLNEILHKTDFKSQRELLANAKSLEIGQK